MGDISFFEGVWPVFAVMAGYVLLSALAQVVAHPARRQLLAIAADLQNDKRANDKDVARIDFFLDIAMSWKVALIIPLAIFSVLADVLLDRSEVNGKGWLEQDPRLTKFLVCFIISISAANIIMSIINAILLLVALLCAGLMQISFRGLVKTSSFRAANSLRQSHSLRHSH